MQKLLSCGGMHWVPLLVNFMSNTSQSSSTHEIQGALRYVFIMLHPPCYVAVHVAAALIIARPHFDAVLITSARHACLQISSIGWLFLEVLGQYAGCTLVWTDGSV